MIYNDYFLRCDYCERKESLPGYVINEDDCVPMLEFLKRIEWKKENRGLDEYHKCPDCIKAKKKFSERWRE